VTYVVCLDAAELRRIDTRLEIELRLTKAPPRRSAAVAAPAGRLRRHRHRLDDGTADELRLTIADLGPTLRPSPQCREPVR